jgi:hypothetical protein
MRKFILFATIFAIPIVMFPQKKRVMLFEEYTSGTVLMNNKTKIRTPLNYDASNKAMMFIHGEDEMILTDNEKIDTVYIGTHKFIYAKDTYLEYVQRKHGNIYIDWSLKDVIRGSEGVYGQVTQSRVESINKRYWEQGKDLNQSSDVHALSNENKYQFLLNGEIVTCKSKKELLNLFKDKKEEINNFINKHSLNFRDASDALTIIDYCLSLK